MTSRLVWDGNDKHRWLDATRRAVTVIAMAFAITVKSAEPLTRSSKPPSDVIRTQQPVGPKYEATPQGETGPTEAQPIDASGAKSVEGVGAHAGLADTPPPPTPLDSDGDGYYNYSEVHYPDADPYDATRYPAVPPATANTQWHDWYLQQIKGKSGSGKYYLAGSGAGPAAATRVVHASPNFIQRTGQGVSKAARSTVNVVKEHPYTAAGVGVAVVAVAAVAVGSGGGGGGGTASGGSKFAGTLSGGMSGVSGPITVTSGFTMTIGTDGSVTFSCTWGTANGSVNANGGVTASGDGGHLTGTITRSGNTLYGSGGWSATGVAGGWSGSGPASQ